MFLLIICINYIVSVFPLLFEVHYYTLVISEKACILIQASFLKSTG